MNEQLIVKNFGPIKDATVDFKRVTVFIGPTGGGKSTLAKLASIVKKGDNNNGLFEAQFSFEDYSIHNYIQPNTFIDWTNSIGSGITINNPETMDIDKFIKTQEYKINLSPEKLNQNITDKIKFLDIENTKEEVIKRLKERGINNINEKSLQDLIISSQEELEKNVINKFYRKNIFLTDTHYIPSERGFIPAIEYSWAGLIRDDIGIPKQILEFANDFSLSRKSISELEISFLNVKYIHRDGQDSIKVPQSETLFRLYETASGIQSVTPMLVLLEHLSRQKEQAQSFIIEEPELNLYPTAQQGLMNWLVEKCTKGENDLTITTHSPYILSSCNLLIEAYKVWQKRPELEAEIDKIVPKASWINPDEFAAYYVADGGVRPIVDERTDLIGGNELDSISGDIADSFRKLLRLQKQPANA